MKKNDGITPIAGKMTELPVSEADASELAKLDEAVIAAKIAFADHTIERARLEKEHETHVFACAQAADALQNKFHEIARAYGIDPEHPDGSWTYKVDLKKFVRIG